MSNSLRIIFFGTPTFSALHLNALIEANYKIIGVLTQPDRPSGRGKRLTVSPVKLLAQQHNLPIFQPVTLMNQETYQSLAMLKADIIVVVAYGLILPPVVLNMPRLGCINVHSSLLPRWRGAAPIQRALLAGDQQTGVTIIQMDNGLDTGAILYQLTYNIQPDDTSASLYDKLAQIGSHALLITLAQIKTGTTQPQPQNDAQATYATKISKQEAQLAWALPAEQLVRCIRAFNPWPISYFFLMGQPIKVWEATVIIHHPLSVTVHSVLPGTILAAHKSGIDLVTGNGILRLTLLQPPGKKIMSVFDFLNARRKLVIPGYILE